ncbi:MAG: tRNA (guanosine(37)-N1)-methyltransferase TrmD [Bdellovibrio sp.]|nr:MAG: tRNA (guanosine(37)-N1)-methyltransferase TrmD [Bdellovibrio sp.]
MIRFQVVTSFPEMIEESLRWGVVGQAQKKGLLQLRTENPRQFSQDFHQSIDDRPFGGGDGMVYLPDPLGQTIEKCKAAAPAAEVLYLSPQGQRLDDSKVRELALDKDFILVCGRYGGIDERIIRRWVDQEISIGDYVLSGGELAAAVLIDVLARQCPGVLGHADSAANESFRGHYLEGPSFTRPRMIWGMTVPEVLLSGDHARIREWKYRVSQLVTWQKRRDLFEEAMRELPVNERRREMQRLLQFWQSLSGQEREVLGLQINLDFDFDFNGNFSPEQEGLG